MESYRGSKINTQLIKYKLFFFIFFCQKPRCVPDGGGTVSLGDGLSVAVSKVNIVAVVEKAVDFASFMFEEVFDLVGAIVDGGRLGYGALDGAAD